jgi:hypothetical protein
MEATGAPEAGTRQKAYDAVEKESAVFKQKDFGSHKIHVRRKDFDSHYPKEVRAEAVLRISSIFVNRQPLRGFDLEDEKKYLNGILDVSPSHQDWEKHTRIYWLEKRIPIGFAGQELEIGKNEDGTPIDITDWINYNFIKRHPLVAPSEAEMNRSSVKMFFISDPRKETIRKNASVQISKQADREFIKATDDPKRMANMLTVLTKAPVHTYDKDTIENMLFDIKGSRPQDFLNVAMDETLDLRAEIAGFIQEQILVKVGASLVYGNDTIADTEDDCIRVLKNPKNSGLLNVLRTKYKEAIR